MSRVPSNIARQLTAARELAALAHAGLSEGSTYPVIVAQGEAEVAVHIVDNALRRLMLTQMMPLSVDDKLRFVTGMANCLGGHIGRLLHGLPSDIVQDAVTRSTQTMITSLGADLSRSGVDVTMSTDARQEVLH